ncbi:MAG: substrate-binding domain-containing protein [Caulobacterales bacterium]|nr:substrate-binding domain-containing protein [Caulobacterales bacterium]
MKKSFLVIVGILGLFSACSKQEAPRSRISIVGSSTVFPFASAVAEQFGAANGGSVPKVEANGTGGGIKVFCSNTGLASVDIANASRQMKKSEFEDCQKNGVNEIIEVKIGYDGIVLAGAKSGELANLSQKEIFLAVAKEVPLDGKFVPNPNMLWSDINPSFPKTKIEIMGPPPTSGTRDAFVELILEKGAMKIDALKSLHESDKEAFKKAATTIREDGIWKDMGENDNLIVQALNTTPKAIGIFGFSFFEENTDKLKAIKIENKAPEMADITSGEYPASRSLYFYVKKANISYIPAIKGYMSEFISPKAIGKNGYLISRGLIPLKAEEVTKQLEIISNQTLMVKPN